ncbi:hypothetical protein [Erwinia phage vB_Ea277G]|nr:hypothetical protein [Erwinia phage vB_Ea277G]
MNASNNANVNVNVNGKNELVVTVAGKDYVFDKNKSNVGKVNLGGEFPFPIFDGIKNDIAKNNWVAGYVTQEFNGKQAALIMAGPIEEMMVGETAMTWFALDVNAPEAEEAQVAKLVSSEKGFSTYEANGKKFCFDDTTAENGSFIKPDYLGVVLPAAIQHALAKPCRMAVFKYQAKTLMIEVYQAPRSWGMGSDGIWIIEDVETLNIVN